MSATIVETSYGKVQGEKIGEVYAWKGIPYAKPPLGRLRFRPPQKLETWEGIRDAKGYGPVSPQTSSVIMNLLGNNIENMNEDCLYLNVWSKGTDQKRRPVMVWIHGGAFISGSGSSPWYDGESFAAKGDVVVVTINYRLGALGFLHLGEIGGEEFATSGNCGILDQVAALQWVKENIASFGGDPDRITIFGESAGAMSVGVLLGLPAAKGLFHQAILQSGAAKNALPAAKATKMAERFLALLEVDASNLAKLQDMPIDQILMAQALLPPMSLQPVIDGISLPQSPEEAIAEGAVKDLSILIGTNKDEYRLFTFFDPVWQSSDAEKIKSLFQRTFGELWTTISKEWSETPLNQELYDQLMTINVFTYPAIKLAEQQVSQGAQVWMYRFDWESPVFNGGLKSSHAIEIPFVWNTINSPNTERIIGNSPDRQEVSDRMHEAWISFAKYGNPNTEALSGWEQYDLNNRTTMIFNHESKTEFDPNYKGCLKWEKAISNPV